MSCGACAGLVYRGGARKVKKQTRRMKKSKKQTRKLKK